MIVEHESFFESCANVEIKHHGLALIALIRNILKDCKSCPHRLNIEKEEPGLTLWKTMQKRMIEEALKQWPERRMCAKKLGINNSTFNSYVNQWNITVPEGRKPEE